MRLLTPAILTLILSAMLLSCAGESPSAPDVDENPSPLTTSASLPSGPGTTYLWGMYDISFDPENDTAIVDFDRHASFAVNVVNNLNRQPSNVQINVLKKYTAGEKTTFVLDITLVHPYPGLPQFNGYDVRGVFMGNGSAALAWNPGLAYPVIESDQAIISVDADNAFGPDGYTRWFNMPEFSLGGLPLFSYTQGEKAPPDYSPNATLCPYQYFADGLGATDNVCDWLKTNPASNGVFASGSANTRRYAISFPSLATKLRFGYAVIACWEGVNPDDHPANADEAVTAEATVSDSLWYESPDNNGGDLVADFSLYSWKGLPTGIIIESTVLSSTYTLTSDEMVPIASGDNYATFHVEIRRTTYNPGMVTSSG